MTEKEKTLIKSYLVSEDFRKSEEIRELQSRVRFRKIDIVDCIELALCIERYDSFKEFSRCIHRLLEMGE